MDVAKQLLKELGIVVAVLAYLFGSFLLGQLLFDVFGIGGLIGWGLGFVLVSGGLYFYFLGRGERGPLG